MRKKIVIEVEPTGAENCFDVYDHKGFLIIRSLGFINGIKELQSDRVNDKNALQELVQLKAAGFTAQDIIEMKNSGVI